MVAVNRGLLVDHSRRGVITIQENGTGRVRCTVKQRVEVFGVVVGLHHGIVDVGSRHINPTHNLGVCLSKRIEVDNRHAAGVLIAYILLLDFLVRIARLLIANLSIDKDGSGGDNQTDAHDDEQDGNDGSAFLTRLLGIVGRRVTQLPRRPSLLLCRAI